MCLYGFQVPRMINDSQMSEQNILGFLAFSVGLVGLIWLKYAPSPLNWHPLVICALPTAQTLLLTLTLSMTLLNFSTRMQC